MCRRWRNKKATFDGVLTNKNRIMRFPKHVLKSISRQPELKKRFDKEEKARSAKASKPTEEKK